MGQHGAFVPLDKYWELGEAILTTYRDYGYRYNPRGKCRLAQHKSTKTDTASGTKAKSTHTDAGTPSALYPLQSAG